MVLVAQASPAGLRPALCRLLAELGEVKVRLRAPELASLAPGDVALLRVVPEDILWLNYNRPLVSERRLKLVLWAEGEVASAMRAQAPDFFDWISHVLPCPRLTPGFAVAGVKALSPRSSARWDGEGLVGALQSAGQESIVVFEDSSRHYRSLQRAARGATSGVAWTAVDRPRRLHRARWAMAEGRVDGPCLLLDAALPTPGWVSLHARCQDWGEAAAALAAAGVAEPAREAALLGLEPEAIRLRVALSSVGAPPPPPPTRAPLADEGARLAEHAAAQAGVNVPASLAQRAGLPLAEDAQTTTLDRRVTALAEALRVAEEASAEPWLKASREALDLGHPDAALSWAQRAARLADTPERIALAEQALGLARLALGDVSTQPDPSEQISRPLALPDLSAAERGRTQLHLAFVALTRGDLPRAEATFQELLLTLDDDAEHRGLRGAAKGGLGRIALAQGALPLARTLAEEALAASPEPRRADSAAAGLLAELLLTEGRAQDAFQAADAHLTAVSAALGEEHPAALRALRLRAETRHAAGDAAGALTDAQRAVRLGDEVQGVDHPDLARARVALGQAFALSGRQDEAIRTIEMAISSAERALPADHLELTRAREALAAALQREGALLVAPAAPPAAEPSPALDLADERSAESVSDEDEDDSTQSSRPLPITRGTLSAAPPPAPAGQRTLSKTESLSSSPSLDAVNRTRKALSAQMRAAYAQRDALVAQGAEVDQAEQEIVTLRKSLRRGPVLQAGELLGEGRYELLERIGQGGFAAVWRALDRETNKIVALKVLHPHWADQPSRRDRFVRGAQVMRTLKHPHLLRVLSDAQEEDGFWFFAMEHLPGGDLSQALAAGRLGPSRAIDAVLEVGEALAEAHKAGIIHRDVKPANILFDAAGGAYLSDFDLVESLERSATLSLGGMGTFLYAAPELLDADPRPSPRADVYSLGMVALTCYRGGQDPPAPSVGILRVLDDTSAPAPVKALLRQVLSADPSQRPADAAAFVEDLRDALHDHDTPSAAEELFVLPPPRPSAPAQASVGGRGSLPSWRRLALVASTLLAALAGWGVGRVMTDPLQLVSALPTEPSVSPLGPSEAASDPVPSPGLRSAQTYNAPSLALTAPLLFTEIKAGETQLLMSVTEVTNTQWDALRDDNPSLKPSSHLPVTGVSAQAAMEYANALSKAEGLTPAYIIDEQGAVTLDPTSNGYRLPTLDEWEAARAQTLPERVETSGPTRAVRVESLPDQPVGMGSNAAEWVWTDEGPALAGRSWINPKGELRRPKTPPRDAGVRLVRSLPSPAAPAPRQVTGPTP
ncbi:protein kinase [Myxococcota bacterium]|nr:protein kinase [Myxococcota bacterium]